MRILNFTTHSSLKYSKLTIVPIHMIHITSDFWITSISNRNWTTYIVRKKNVHRVHGYKLCIISYTLAAYHTIVSNREKKIFFHRQIFVFSKNVGNYLLEKLFFWYQIHAFRGRFKIQAAIPERKTTIKFHPVVKLPRLSAAVYQKQIIQISLFSAKWLYKLRS